MLLQKCAPSSKKGLTKLNSFVHLFLGSYFSRLYSRTENFPHFSLSLNIFTPDSFFFLLAVILNVPLSLRKLHANTIQNIFFSTVNILRRRVRGREREMCSL